MEREGRYGDIQGRGRKAVREGGREGGETDHNLCSSSMRCMSVKSCPPNAWHSRWRCH